MKIKNPNAGALTNFEVLDFLRSRGASKDVSRVLAPVATSEYKAYDYLVETPACNQTRENINEFLERFKKYNLAKAELLNIINIRPSQTVEIYTIIEEMDSRFEMPIIEELVELVEEVLPPPPGQPKAEGGTGENEEENGEGEENNDENEAADEEEPETS
ncbi:calsequestrin [Salix suchowensis]|nr:calsequestrin [Salix suchowensis]